MSTLPAVDPARVDALAAELRTLLGELGVSDEDASLERASIDGSHLSPVIGEQLPLGRAQLVAFPTTAEQIAEVVGAAVRHGVPITPRGKGTGNYGQGIPMSGGLVLDTSKARAIIRYIASVAPAVFCRRGDMWMKPTSIAPLAGSIRR